MTGSGAGIWSGISTGDVAIAARGGSEGAFETLYRRYGGRVYGLCLHLSGDPARAGDLTQDVFVRVWQGLPMLRNPASFRAWIRQVTLNIVRNEFRSARRREARVIAAEDLDEFSLEAAQDIDTRLSLEASLALLPPRYRNVFVLHDVAGFSHHEIAELLALPPATVRVHLHRARMQLRAALTA